MNIGKKNRIGNASDITGPPKKRMQIIKEEPQYIQYDAVEMNTIHQQQNLQRADQEPDNLWDINDPRYNTRSYQSLTSQPDQLQRFNLIESQSAYLEKVNPQYRPEDHFNDKTEFQSEQEASAWMHRQNQPQRHSNDVQYQDFQDQYAAKQGPGYYIPIITDQSYLEIGDQMQNIKHDILQNQYQQHNQLLVQQPDIEAVEKEAQEVLNRVDTDICDSTSNLDIEDDQNQNSSYNELKDKTINKRIERSIKIFDKKMKSAEELIPESVQNDIQKKRFIGSLRKNIGINLKKEAPKKIIDRIFGNTNEAKAEEDEDSDSEPENQISSDIPKIDFKQMLKDENREGQTEYPVTKTHVEDCMFYQTESKKDVFRTDIIALECVFYQANCQYYSLDVPMDGSMRNRMGTENYEKADYDQRTKNMTFNQPPLNLVVSKTKSYLKQENILLSSMQTENKEATAEYYLTLWSINQKGGISKKQQSPSFKFPGTFQDHYQSNLQIRISETQSYIYIVQGYDNNNHGTQHSLALKVWKRHEKDGLIELPPGPIEAFNQYLTQTANDLFDSKNENRKKLKEFNE